jgi:hypothetical protein
MTAAISAAVTTFEMGPSGHHEQAVFHIIVNTFYRPAGAAVFRGGVGPLAAFDLFYKHGYSALGSSF